MSVRADDIEKVFEEGLGLYKSTAKLLFSLPTVIDATKGMGKLTTELDKLIKVKVEADEIDYAAKMLRTKISHSNHLENFSVYKEFDASLAEVKGKVNMKPYDALKDNFKKYIKKLTPKSDIGIEEMPRVKYDPWTHNPIQQMVTNDICGHIYELSSIEKFVRGKKKVKCPYMGCQSIIDEKKLTVAESTSSSSQESTVE